MQQRIKIGVEAVTEIFISIKLTKLKTVAIILNMICNKGLSIFKLKLPQLLCTIEGSNHYHTGDIAFGASLLVPM